MITWKQWKRIRTSPTNLTKSGVKKSKAGDWVKTRKGYWPTTGSFLRSITITSASLTQAFLRDWYRKVGFTIKGMTCTLRYAGRAERKGWRYNPYRSIRLHADRMDAQ
ncbi:hypothetical protein [Cyclobacterium xiamenense]|uniref:hypothetical protein n=1 Tax=Cyclobacterium xiamenense TaxID=1297121 RepID=UPI0035CFB29C